MLSHVKKGRKGEKDLFEVVGRDRNTEDVATVEDGRAPSC